MRISDWSSDVCSSDLTFCAAVFCAAGFFGAAFLAGAFFAVDFALARCAVVAFLARSAGVASTCAASAAASMGLIGAGVDADSEIGREACRERVCPYVLISLFAGSVKNK